MSTKWNYNIVLSLLIGLTLWGCSVPKIAFKETENKLPENFSPNYNG
jgi:hypothetical protein